jgi:hypothetical protein
MRAILLDGVRAGVQLDTAAGVACDAYYVFFRR